MNRQPRSDIEKISKKLEDKAKEPSCAAKIAEYINQEIKPLIGATLDMRMVERAKFFFAKKQYLKALILLYEGLIIAIGRKHGFGSGLDYGEREKIRQFINDNESTVFSNVEQRKTYTDLKWTRNAAVHGSRSQGTQNYIENEEQFRMLFNQALELYKNVIGDKLC